MTTGTKVSRETMRLALEAMDDDTFEAFEAEVLERKVKAKRDDKKAKVDVFAKIGPELKQHVSKWATESYQSIEATMTAVIESAIAWFEDNGLNANIKCPVHEGQIHGGEAQELRKGIEEILKEMRGGDGDETMQEMLQNLLDKVDARDSLGHLEYECMLLKKAEERHFTELANLDENRTLILKAMGVMSPGYTWSWIIQELNDRHAWMLKTRAELREVEVKKRESVTTFDPNRRMVPFDLFSPVPNGQNRMKIGDIATIAYAPGQYGPARVVQVLEDHYIFEFGVAPRKELVTGYTADQLMKVIEGARWEGWLAALDAIQEVFAFPDEEITRNTIAGPACAAIEGMLRGFRHRDLMEKAFKEEYPNG